MVCNGIPRSKFAHPKLLVVLANVRSDVEQPSRPERPYIPARGPKAAKPALPARPAKLEDFTCRLSEAGTPVVRGQDCIIGEAVPWHVSLMCLECRNVLVSVVDDRCVKADKASAQLDVLGSLLAGQTPDPARMRLLSSNKTHSGRTTHWSKEPSREGQIRGLLQVLNGFSGQLECFTPQHRMRLQLLTEQQKTYELVQGHAELGSLPPTVTQFVQTSANDGLCGHHMHQILAMYVNGSLQERHQALFGLLMAVAQRTRSIDKGGSGRGMELPQSAIDFFTGMGMHTKAAVKDASLNLLGFELDLAKLRRKRVAILNLPRDVELEFLNPSPEQLQQTCEVLVRSWRRGAEPVVQVSMDPTKVARKLQFDQRRGVLVGGDTLSGRATIDLPKRINASQFAEISLETAPADQANLISVAPQVAGYSVLEVCATLLLSPLALPSPASDNPTHASALTCSVADWAVGLYPARGARAQQVVGRAFGWASGGDDKGLRLRSGRRGAAKDECRGHAGGLFRLRWRCARYGGRPIAALDRGQKAVDRRLACCAQSRGYQWSFWHPDHHVQNDERQCYCWHP